MYIVIPKSKSKTSWFLQKKRFRANGNQRFIEVIMYSFYLAKLLLQHKKMENTQWHNNVISSSFTAIIIR